MRECGINEAVDKFKASIHDALGIKTEPDAKCGAPMVPGLRVDPTRRRDVRGTVFIFYLDYDGEYDALCVVEKIGKWLKRREVESLRFVHPICIKHTVAFSEPPPPPYESFD